MPNSAEDRLQEPEPQLPLTSFPTFPKLGVKLQVLRELSMLCPTDATTNFVCHEMVKQKTTPAGWVDTATITDADKGWYSHAYHQGDPSCSQPVAPPGAQHMRASRT